ncbi:MAG TPA: UPF0182 family protein [Actinomycetota bacterium]
MTIRPARSPRRRMLTFLAVLAGVVIIGFTTLSGFYTEVLWFREEAGYEQVFWTEFWTKLGLGVVFGAVFALLVLVNLWLVKKLTKPERMFTVPDQVLERYRATFQPYMRTIVIGSALLFGLFAGSSASTQWREWLQFSNGVDVGTADDVFGRDIGFFLFRLPFHRFLFTWTFSALLVATIVSAVGHYFMGGIRPLERRDRVAPEVRAHLSVLLGLIVLLKAWGYRLDQYNLLFSERGTVVGASYTDVNAQLPALKLLVVVAIVVSLFFFLNARIKNWLLPAAAIGILALMSILAGGAYPALVQRFRVVPNEQKQEELYITRNIESTRAAFGLDEVEVRDFPAASKLTAKDIRTHRDTIQNIRLWDPAILGQQYVTLQRIRQYYDFTDVDIDRYEFDGVRRQVMLSAREIDTRGLQADAQSWLNEHLIYTHGYGLVASRVDRVTTKGQPEFIYKEIPPVGVEEGAPAIEDPQIYYGENDSPAFVVARSTQPELDYPQGDSDSFQTNTYDGEGGIALSGFLRKAAFAWRFRDVNLLVSGALGDDALIIFRRSVADRVRRVAPFARFDRDPYIAIIDGRLVWILDGYTTSEMYPYSQRTNFAADAGNFTLGSGNYIRNSLKFTVDAKDGTITGYVWDEEDPVLKVWRSVYPDLLQPKEAMPPGVRAHVRYPEDLFKIQTEQLGRYHITDPSNFYSGEDVWTVALDPTQQADLVSPQPQVPPYYVLQTLPGEEGLDFVLVRPFTPRERQNLSAYVVAHADPDEYGKIVTYRFPKNEAILGPQQINSRINADPIVSPQLTLLDQQSSEVIPGNLLIVPLEDSLLYVQPLYLKGEGSELPELRRVVAVHGENIIMAETLGDALAGLFDAKDLGAGPSEPAGTTVAELLASAGRHFDRAFEALGEGDLATFQREIELARRDNQRAQEALGAGPPPPASPTPSPGPS